MAEHPDLSCPVCMMPFTSSERIPIDLGCGHCFCSPCIERSVASFRRCPECRATSQNPHVAYALLRLLGSLPLSPSAPNLGTGAMARSVSQSGAAGELLSASTLLAHQSPASAGGSSPASGSSADINTNSQQQQQPQHHTSPATAAAAAALARATGAPGNRDSNSPTATTDVTNHFLASSPASDTTHLLMQRSASIHAHEASSARARGGIGGVQFDSTMHEVQFGSPMHEVHSMPLIAGTAGMPLRTSVSSQTLTHSVGGVSPTAVSPLVGTELRQRRAAGLTALQALVESDNPRGGRRGGWGGWMASFLNPSSNQTQVVDATTWTTAADHGQPPPTAATANGVGHDPDTHRAALVGRAVLSELPHAVQEVRSSFWSWAGPILGIIYLISPIDLIPDFIPLLGWMDDMVVLGTVIYMIYHLATSVPQLVVLPGYGADGGDNGRARNRHHHHHHHH